MGWMIKLWYLSAINWTMHCIILIYKDSLHEQLTDPSRKDELPAKSCSCADWQYDRELSAVHPIWSAAVALDIVCPVFTSTQATEPPGMTYPDHLLLYWSKSEWIKHMNRNGLSWIEWNIPVNRRICPVLPPWLARLQYLKRKQQTNVNDVEGHVMTERISVSFQFKTNTIIWHMFHARLNMLFIILTTWLGLNLLG